MVSKDVEITNITGMHLGPAGRFCDTAMRFDSRVMFRYGENSEANAKSMLSVLGAEIAQGDRIEIVCDGPDEKEALQTLVTLVENQFEY